MFYVTHLTHTVVWGLVVVLDNADLQFVGESEILRFSNLLLWDCNFDWQLFYKTCIDIRNKL